MVTMRMVCTCMCTSSNGGGVVEVAEALKPGGGVPTGNRGFMEAKWVMPGMIGADVASVGLLVISVTARELVHPSHS